MSSDQNPEPIPDLAAILRTLAHHSGQSVPVDSAPNADPRVSSGGRIPQTHPQLQHHHPSQISGQVTQKQAPAPIDPSRITTYPAALRFTTALLARQPDLTTRIRKLIHSQHEHEKQWWTGRALVPAECRKRVEGRRAVNDVLRALGGVVNDSDGRSGGETVVKDDDVKKALKDFDSKVYTAAQAMIADVRKQLKEMGIPGFVLRREMIGEEEGKITKTQLIELERKMLQLLEDLCKD